MHVQSLRKVELDNFPMKHGYSLAYNLSGLLILLVCLCGKWSYIIMGVKRN